MEPLRVAIIGCGPRSYGHAKGVQVSGALSLKYACDIRPERVEKAALDWDVEAVADYRHILDDPEIEAVLIVTDVQNHLPIVRDALAAGKHIICEKPFGDDVMLAREMVRCAEASDLVTYVNFQLRFMPKQLATKRVAEEMDPVQIFFGRSRGMMRDHFLNPSTFCGIMDCCAHDFDQLAWLMGRNPTGVTAVVRRNTFTEDTGATDTISALVDFGDGRSATAVSSIGAAEIGSKFDIAGALGNVTVARNGEVKAVRFGRNDSAGDKQAVELELPQGANADAELQRAFCAQVREGTPSEAATFRDGLNSLLLTVACLTSSDEGRRVALDEVQ
ncbi:MAG: Gfo/Idh/MocA family oxidoreductase [Lentisphaerae bacterium]|jgi:myo-inositol 2-dehydrogenase / D-chiro-inositol 1-dehydrogenase|nr:Gfo/Idh/MocA family oxidoreductase [Lentisphaerota bacterium]MBT4821338.1 Gfo/Idh/MocA family oxidoreductase [Lentisphaerota bacterium]MBT5611852.1 Gfo/Idh/MocA family oxidoreductase [Lentisphaerota bacterium]MBT7059309.1 Gfo/Idh/MocA family oxidoreductase [Lentisphaerota bacterium]MBT7843832.1 Gfo/Idh/MocA family oxidoreductase [Lentisphaerota bacterium]